QRRRDHAGRDGVESEGRAERLDRRRLDVLNTAGGDVGGVWAAGGGGDGEDGGVVIEQRDRRRRDAVNRQVRRRQRRRQHAVVEVDRHLRRRDVQSGAVGRRGRGDGEGAVGRGVAREAQHVIADRR